MRGTRDGSRNTATHQPIRASTTSTGWTQQNPSGQREHVDSQQLRAGNTSLQYSFDRSVVVWRCDDSSTSATPARAMQAVLRTAAKKGRLFEPVARVEPINGVPAPAERLIFHNREAKASARLGRANGYSTK
eukprot:2602973-Rhodomonas_salina.1